MGICWWGSVELWLGLHCERPVGMAGCGGRRRGSVCSRGARRCSWVGDGRLLVLGGRSGSREASRPSAQGWPNQCGRCVPCVGGMMGPVMFPSLYFGCVIEDLGAGLPKCEWHGQLVSTGRRGWSSA